jgi:uncharacterized protein YjbJ (UPF0337 family)
MNFNQFETQGHKMDDQVKAKWSKLSDEEVTKSSGKKEQLVGKVQERYSLSKTDAMKQVDEWITALPAISSNVVATAGATHGTAPVATHGSTPVATHGSTPDATHAATPATPMVDSKKPAVPHV